MAETAAELQLFDAIEEYVARAMEPLQREIAALRGELANRMKGDPGAKGEPGQAAQVDYDHIGEIISLGVAKEVAKLTPEPGAPGTDGKDAVVDYSVVKEFVAAAAVSAVAALPKAKDGSPGKDADEAAIVERVLARIPVPKDGAPGIDADEDFIVEQVVARIPVPKDGANGKDVDQAAAAALITHEVTRQVALIRQPEDGKSVTVDDVRPVLAEMVKAIPVPKDGRDADESVVVARVFAQIPTPKDGAAGRDADESAVVTRVLEQITVPKDGAPGRDADEDAIVARVRLMIPTPKDGRDADEDAIVERLRTLIPAAPDEDAMVERVIAQIPKPKDGRDGESVHRDTVRVMVVEMVEEVVLKQVDRIPPPKDGKDADPVELERMVDGKIASQFEQLLPYLKGEPGPAGLSPEDLEVEFKGERTLIVRFVRDGVSIAERSVRLAGIPMEKGLYVRGARYDCGDVVTYGGSAFIAVRDTSAEIGGTTKSPDWRLLVQRGRDAT